ncbi:MAG TPA: hypothetical protein VIV11_10640 [Kofleriaceae bacterium]
MRTMVIAGLLVFSATIARADKVGLMHNAGNHFKLYFEAIEQIESKQKLRIHKTPDDCVAAVKRWQSEGLKLTDFILTDAVRDHPKAKVYKNATGITLADMLEVCEHYRKLYAVASLPIRLEAHEQGLDFITNTVKGDDVAITEQMIQEQMRRVEPAACKATVDAARAHDPKMKAGRDQLSLDDYAKKVCDVLAVETPKWLALAKETFAKRLDEAKAPFVAAGITGDKLDTLISHHGVSWRLPGGSRTDDPKKLASASVLYLWLEGDNPNAPGKIHTVRRFQFKGNKLTKKTEQKYPLKPGQEPKNSWYR